MGWDKDTLLGQSIYNNKDSSKAIRRRRLFNKIHGDRIPWTFQNWKRQE